MRELVTIELTWEQVVEKMEDILSRILGVNLECSTTQDDTDFLGGKARWIPNEHGGGWKGL